MYLLGHHYMKKIEKYLCNFNCRCQATNSEELDKMIKEHEKAIRKSNYYFETQETILSYLSIY